MSKHFYLLKQAGLIEARKDGRWVYYALPGREAPLAVREALDWVMKALADDPRVVEDRTNLKQVLKFDPTELCKKQCRR
jgi:DNA-binding transcriptional ArsR family regulator